MVSTTNHMKILGIFGVPIFDKEDHLILKQTRSLLLDYVWLLLYWKSYE